MKYNDLPSPNTQHKHKVTREDICIQVLMLWTQYL